MAPRIIDTFLESYDFSGKTLVPFATSGGSGLGETESILHGLCPDTVSWKPGKLLKQRDSVETLAAWEEGLEGLREQLSELEDMLDELQDREPEDMFSSAYDRWEERCEALEEKTSELEDVIEVAEAEM